MVKLVKIEIAPGKADELISVINKKEPLAGLSVGFSGGSPKDAFAR